MHARSSPNYNLHASCTYADLSLTLSSVHGVSSFLQIIRSRYESPKSSVKTTDKPGFQLKHLEEDLVRQFIAGKPLIESPSSIRTLFKFKQSIRSDVTIPDE